MATTAEIAEFVQSTTYEDLSGEVVDEIKKRLVDSIGIALGSIGEDPVEIVRETVEELHPYGGACDLWGGDETAAPSEATMLNTALIRYLDYNDSILAPGEVPHPSDNVGAAIACGQYADRSGEELIAGVGIAYEIHGEMGWKAPGRDIGWDHIHVIFSSTAVASKLLGLDYEQTRNAIGLGTAGYNPLRVTRTGEISMWKGIASANLARNGVYSAILAKNGMEGPTDAFEGQKGWKEIVFGGDFEVEFTPCERVLNVMTKRYMAGTHAQPAIEGILELIERNDIDPHTIDGIHLETYESAAHVMGGGEGDRHTPENREQADHSIPYCLAAAALDGKLSKDQYELERIRSDDVRELTRTVTVAEDPELTHRFNEGEQPCRLRVTTTENGEYVIEKSAFEGHHTNRMSWAEHGAKFHEIAKDVYDEQRRIEIIETVKNLEEHDVQDLVDLLE